MTPGGKWVWIDLSDIEAIKHITNNDLEVKEGFAVQRIIDAYYSDTSPSFNSLIEFAKAMLAEHYPDDIFPDLDDPAIEGDPGPALVRALRRCIEARRV